MKQAFSGVQRLSAAAQLKRSNCDFQYLLSGAKKSGALDIVHDGALITGRVEPDC